MEFQTINIFAIQAHWFIGDPKTIMTHIFVSTRIRVANKSFERKYTIAKSIKIHGIKNISNHD